MSRRISLLLTASLAGAVVIAAIASGSWPAVAAAGSFAAALLSFAAARFLESPRDPDDTWDAFEREFWCYVEEPGAAVPAPPPESGGDELRALSELLHEGLDLFERVDELLPEIRDDEGPRAELAHRGAPVVSRLQAMRDELVAIRAPELRGLAREAEALVNFYGQHLYYALSLLATSWRHERLRDQRERLGPVGWAQLRLVELVEAVDAMRAAAHGDL